MVNRFLSTVLLLVAFSCTSFALKQEIWLHLEGGNALYFNQNTPDLSDYATLLTKVVRICSLGRWYGFRGVNYLNSSSSIGNAGRTDLVCFDLNNDYGWPMRSIRYLADSDTSVDAVSLYEGTYFEGSETKVTQRAFTGISHKVESFAGTGTSDWMLFDGQFLDGNYYCFRVPYPGWYMEYSVSLLGFNYIKTIGSVFKGCDLKQIQNYREAHFLS